jgi:hypothetical protein
MQDEVEVIDVCVNGLGFKVIIFNSYGFGSLDWLECISNENVHIQHEVEVIDVCVNGLSFRVVIFNSYWLAVLGEGHIYWVGRKKFQQKFCCGRLQQQASVVCSAFLLIPFCWWMNPTSEVYLIAN